MGKIVADLNQTGALPGTEESSGGPSVWLAAKPRRLVVLCLAFLLGASLGVALVWPLVVTLCAIGLLVVVACSPGRTRRAPVVFLVFLVGYFHAIGRIPFRSSTDVSRFVGRTITFDGRVEAIRPVKDGQILTMRVSQIASDSVKVSGQIAVLYKRSPEFEPSSGKTLRLRARICAPASAKYPYEFDASAALARKGIFTQCRVTGRDVVEVVSQGNIIDSTWSIGDSIVSRWRSRIVLFHQRILGLSAGSLLSSMVLGDRAVILCDGDKQIFRDAGLSHVLAASGYNLTVVLVIAAYSARLLVRSRRILCCFCLASIGVFVLLAGVSPSIFRAAIMCVFIVIARYGYRRLHMPAVLVCALSIAVALDPLSMTDIGLQLSYTATAAMIFCSRAFPRTCNGWRETAVELIATTMIAQSSVFPLQLLYFYETSLYFLPANLLASLFVPVVCSLGFASSLLVLLQPLLPFLDQPARWITQINSVPLFALTLVVRYVSALPGAVVALGPPSPVAVVLFYCSLVGLFIFGRRYRLGGWPMAVLGLAFVLLAWRPPLEKELCLSIGRRTTLIIHVDRSATCCRGVLNSSAARRALAYYGVNKVEFSNGTGN
ncbi:MAG: competence protein ComEC family protein [Candidatus Obscuribacterales bacterium]|nr:competence protein ComEC family protein [Candidatus Obscuribacterales bacterium]